MDEASLVAAVLAAPDDDAPRLIYADWLQERGDPRGEFIALQIQYERDPSRWQLASRAQELQKQHGAAWRPDIRGLSVVKYRRGFAEGIFMKGEDFLPAAEDVFRLMPIREVTLYQADAQLARIAELPQLRLVRSLDLAGGLGDTGLAVLAVSPHLGGLRKLTLGRAQLGPAGMRALAGAAWGRGLLELNLYQTPIGGAGIEALADSPHLRALRELNLTKCKLDADGVRALAASSILDTVTWLLLAENHLGKGGAVLARSPHLTSLERLNLQTTAVFDAGAEAVAASPHLGNLVELDLSDCAVTDPGVIALSRSQTLARLERLNLTSNGIRETGAQALAAREGLPALKTLGLSYNSIYIPGAIEHGDDADYPVRVSLEDLRVRYGKTVAIE